MFFEFDRSEDAVGDDSELDKSINGIGLAVGDARLGAGASTTFVNPWSGPGGAELDDTCVSDGAGSDTGACTAFVDPWSGPSGAELDDAAGFFHGLKYPSNSRENSPKSSSIQIGRAHV